MHSSGGCVRCTSACAHARSCARTHRLLAGADLRRVRSRVLRPPRCHRRSHRWHIEHHRDVANCSPDLTAAGDCRAHEQFRQCLSDQGGAIGAVLVHSPTGTSLRPYALCTSTYLHAASPPPCARLPGRPCHTRYLAMVCLAAQALACDGQNSVLLSLSQRSCLQCQVGAGPAARSSPLRCNRADLRLCWHSLL